MSSAKKHILFTKFLSDHRKALLEQKIQVTEVKALEPIALPLTEAPELRDWIIVSSPHALESVQELMGNGWGKTAKWGCVGFRSRDKVSDFDIQPVIKADNAKELVTKLPDHGSALYLCGKDRTSTIEDYMGENDWDLSVVETYWTQPTHPKVNFEDFDAVVFFSPRNVDSILRHNSWPNDKIAMAIGPTTAQALRDHGIEPTIVPESPDVLLLIQHYLEYIENGTAK